MEDYSKKTIKELYDRTKEIGNELYIIKSQIQSKISKVKYRIGDENLIENRYSFSSYYYSAVNENIIVFEYSRESRYETYTERLNIPLSAFDSDKGLEEWITPYIKALKIKVVTDNRLQIEREIAQKNKELANLKEKQILLEG